MTLLRPLLAGTWCFGHFAFSAGRKLVVRKKSEKRLMTVWPFCQGFLQDSLIKTACSAASRSIRKSVHRAHGHESSSLTGTSVRKAGRSTAMNILTRTTILW